MSMAPELIRSAASDYSGEGYVNYGCASGHRGFSYRGNHQRILSRTQKLPQKEDCHLLLRLEKLLRLYMRCCLSSGRRTSCAMVGHFRSSFGGHTIEEVDVFVCVEFSHCLWRAPLWFLSEKKKVGHSKLCLASMKGAHLR
jgi:hypothetical protein